MQINGSVEVMAPRHEVFHLMLDPVCLSKTVPGCDKLSKVRDNKYDLTIKVGVAAVKGTYTGTIQLGDIIFPESYIMSVEGKSAVGIVKGTGRIQLADEGEKTGVHYRGDLQVSGKIAAVGNRFLGMIAKMLIGKFFDDMAKEIQSQRASRSAP